MILAGTGHRPEKLITQKSLQYSNISLIVLSGFAREQLYYYKPDKVISGGALGWDTALALAALQLEVPYIMAIPFKGQEVKWLPDAKITYRELLDGAEEVVEVNKGPYQPSFMQRRNEWMVDRCDTLLALWDGELDGGTYNCIKYANKVSKPYENVWGEWAELRTSLDWFRGM